ncbi:conjugative transfer signal peptidase TraF [Novosphingobium kunmingense]|uniref:Conjugative transfer signal peptidase TraF n=1 Tax=Novosphingobium kunmingense TaxID=1211806 RepID=A0A2N0H5V9_9SPHN|nr:S26 family signal peptidase [Novosphingobium kunmingense]PKB14316.1 conjugative transfer signal peptidase TraF [Novosphingobium kunmingense]
MTRHLFVLASVVVAATLATLTIPVSRYAVWNATASVPTGLYAIRGRASLHVGERIAILPPPALRQLLAARNYLPTGVPLLKRIAAVSGQRVCRIADGITIDGAYIGAALARDRLGRPLPVWAGCRVLRTGELFVMNPAAPDSFDGRYFGVLRLADVIGRATPVWTDEAGNGDHQWFADPRSNQPTSSTTEGD